MVKGNMSESGVEIVYTNLEESPYLNIGVLVRCGSIATTPNPLLSLSLLRDEQMVSLGSLLMVDKSSF
jgi:hypothetical protein